MTGQPPLRIRPIAEQDWDGIVALESRAYTPLGLSEERTVLKSRADASPGTCFVLDAGGRLAGYVLALPYPPFHHPDLRRPQTTVPPSRNLHLHDLVIAPGLRRAGLARHLLRHLTLTARENGYRRMSLIAVGGSDTYWARHGFTAHPGPAPDGYGADAVPMSRALPPARGGGAHQRGSHPHDEKS
ncbi:GNAT family N-acetyltransferase [Streptomyces gamaensis]|uniref:GNAT family N-acetyltransferase n=1 Tax=Streptomyces gamaensis TaxID=1763542 RepID=A0ABW0YYU9_9ACTN